VHLARKFSSPLIRVAISRATAEQLGPCRGAFRMYDGCRVQGCALTAVDLGRDHYAMNNATLAALAGAALLTLSGCASNSSNMRVGNDMSYVSLKDQREAALTVTELQLMPEGAASLGTVTASRCHRNTMQAPPTVADVLADLKVAAYAKGADGITGVKVTEGTGLLLNCWTILGGEAIAVRVLK